MWAKLLLVFFVFSFLFRTDSSFDQDLGRHIKIGEIIWQTKTIPLTNLFSYTYPDFPFINSHWLFEVFLYWGQQTVGLHVLLLLKIIILLTAVLLVLKVIPKNQLLLLPVGFIFFHVLRERPDLRPEIFSFLFTALTIYIMEKAEKSKTSLVYLLPLIQFIWVNTHIYFIVGLILQAIYLINPGFQYLRSHSSSGKVKLLAIILGLSVITSFINPSGLKGFLNPLMYGTNYGYTIVENQTMFLLESINFRNPNFLFVKIAFGIILLSILIVILNVVKNLKTKPRDPSLITQDDRGREVKNILLASFGLVLALMNVRSFPYLVFISLPAVLANFGTVKSNWVTKALIFITIPLLFYESFNYLNGEYYKYSGSDVKPKLEFKESGRKALDFVTTNNLPQPIFNNFDIGSYITYRGWPKYKIFVDGRPGEYPKEFFQTVYIPMQSDPQKFAEVDRQYNFQTIIFSHTDQTPWAKTFLVNIVKNPDWKTVYIDDFMIILIKDLRGLKPIDLADLNPDSNNFYSPNSYLRLSLFLAQTGNIASAEKFAKKALTIFPQSPLGNALFGAESPNKFWW
ncbi:hypothetical protein HYS95_01755 [Candidatus Daviesbacteria bacterium]|nr:hypothetical protein [Candidatus Daviesbacteria bacterium]